MNETPNDPRLEALRRRWEAEPSPQAALALAEAYRSSQRPEAGITILRQAIERQPGRLAPKVALGRYLAQIGHRAAAVECLQGVVETDPTHLVANKLLVNLHLDAGQVKQARDRLDLYSLLNSGDPEIEQLEARLANPQAAAAPAWDPSGAEPPPLPAKVADAEPPPPLPPSPPISSEEELEPSQRPTEMLPMDRLTAPLGQGPEVAPGGPDDVFGGAPQPSLPPDHPAAGISDRLEPVGRPQPVEPQEEEWVAGDEPGLDLTGLESFGDRGPGIDLTGEEPAESDAPVAGGLPGIDFGESLGSGLDLADELPGTEEPGSDVAWTDLGAGEGPAVDLAGMDFGAGDPAMVVPLEPEEPTSEPASAEPREAAAAAGWVVEQPSQPDPESVADTAPGADEPTEELLLGGAETETPAAEVPEEERAGVESLDAASAPSGLEPLDLDVPMPATPELDTPLPGLEELETPLAVDGDSEPAGAAPLPDSPAGGVADASPAADDEVAAAPHGVAPLPTAVPFVLPMPEVEPPDLSRLSRLSRPTPAPARGGVIFARLGEQPFRTDWTEGEKARAEQALGHEGLFLGPRFDGGAAAAPAAEPGPVADRAAPPPREVGATVTLARLYQRQGHLEEARQAYHDVLRRDPDHAAARRGLAELEGAPSLITAAELLAGSDPALGAERRKIALLESYLRRLRAGREGRRP